MSFFRSHQTKWQSYQISTSFTSFCNKLQWIQARKQPFGIYVFFFYFIPAAHWRAASFKEIQNNNIIILVSKVTEYAKKLIPHTIIFHTWIFRKSTSKEFTLTFAFEYILLRFFCVWVYIYCRYLWEAPLRGASNDYLQHVLESNEKTINSFG